MGTLMCHYRHRAHGDVFFHPGLQDISAHVDFTALARRFSVHRRSAERGGDLGWIDPAAMHPAFARAVANLPQGQVTNSLWTFSPVGTYSSADLVAALFFDAMRFDLERPRDPTSDRFVLSKGHAAPLLYTALAHAGYFDPAELCTLRKLGSRIQGHPDSKYLPGVEISTGSLGQGLSVACGLAGSRGFGTDNSFEALGVARWNASVNGAEDGIEFVCADLLDCFLPEPAFHFVLSNPPYVSRRDAGMLPREVRDYEPHVALFSGESGLEIYRPLVRQAAPRLLPGGRLLMELGAGQSDEVKAIAQEEGLVPEAVLEDLRGIPRCLVARKGGS